MPISTWIRDLFGIRKDAVDIKKAKLEITKLEAEERERDLITPATMADIEKYDPKLKAIRTKLRRSDHMDRMGIDVLKFGVFLVFMLAIIGGAFSGVFSELIRFIK